MKWIFSLFILFSFNTFAVESTPAQNKTTYTGNCTGSWGAGQNQVMTLEACAALVYSWKQPYIEQMSPHFSALAPWDGSIHSQGSTWIYIRFKHVNGAESRWDAKISNMTTTSQAVCPPSGKSDFTIGPVDLNGSKVCQTVPKTCLMGAAVRIDKDGKETCVANCSAAAGLSNGGAVYYNGGADNTISADDVTCFGQCAVSATTLVQNAAGYYSGPFTFTGANCSVVRPEPVTGSDSAGLNETPVRVDNSNTSEGTQDSLDDLSNAASSSSSTEIDTPSTGANGESTIKDLQQTVKDSAIEQIKSNTSSASNLGNLLSNISSDLQNAIANSGGGGGNDNSSLQLQGNNKLDGINQTLQDISDKLDEPQEEEPPFTPPTSSPNFWENVLPDSSFNDIKSKTESAVQELKDMHEDFRSSIFVSDIAASGTAWADSFTKNGQTFELGSSWFEYAINHGFYAIVILLATMFAVYIVTSRGK